MKTSFRRPLPWHLPPFFFSIAAALALSIAVPLAAAAQPVDGGAAALRSKFDASQTQLQRNAFGRPLLLASTEASDRLSGDIYAVVEHPFPEVGRAMALPAVWCEVLMLHLNTKHCAIKTGDKGTTLAVAIGRKFDQPLADAQRIDFVYGVESAQSDYLDVRLSADVGPLSTRDYRIALEAVPVAGGKTFLHLGYAYAYGTAARLAMKAYLATVGSDKVGFTPSGTDAQGQPDFIGGVRGVVERNTMRYYLAIDAYLDAPGPQARDKRAGQWFDGTERYARQLHELGREDYLAMKRNEFQRLDTARP